VVPFRRTTTGVACILVAVAALLACRSVETAGAMSLARSTIVYRSDSPWPSIWAMGPDGARHRRILRTKQNAKRPRLSPSRRWVAFDGAAPGKPPLSDFDIQLVRLDGIRLRVLTRSRDRDLDAQWSPDGSTLAFTRIPSGMEWPNSWIWAVRPDGTGLRQVVRGESARWSPDGSELAFDAPTPTSIGDIFVSAADGSSPRLVLASPELDQPAGWSPDGQRILFTRFHDEAGLATSVYVVNVDGSDLRKLANGLAGSWSPDGRKIVYTKRFPGRIMVMNADGSRKRWIAKSIGAEPHWR
jgi:Tol biopolymer transport system component